ncbi:MAG: hypothetical protein WDZ75_00865 [Candidatus Paceibacterota bacterium]
MQKDLSYLHGLVKYISCNFIDARSTTKDYLGQIVQDNNLDDSTNDSTNPQGGFVISTCLRYEKYSLRNKQDYQSPFLYTHGVTCLRRLLSILVGLHSEIIGEREIMMQITKSVNTAHDAGCLDEREFQSMQKLFAISKHIRQKCGLSTSENYSTIAADIFVEYLSKCNSPTITIVGGGYMAEKFFGSLLRAGSFSKIERIYWINRSTLRLKEYVAEINNLIDVDIDVLDLEHGSDVLKDSDAIFCALSKSPYLYRNEEYRENSFIVDVSYPQVFANKQKVNLITITNTDFNSLSKNTVPKENIVMANKEIDKVVYSLRTK